MNLFADQQRRARSGELPACRRRAVRLPEQSRAPGRPGPGLRPPLIVAFIRQTTEK